METVKNCTSLPSPESPPGAPRVLVIDDDEMLRAALAEALEVWGYGVTSACDGPSGLAAFERAPADVVVLDLGLPGADGVEVCRALKRRDLLLPVIFLSGCRELSEKLRALEAGDEFCAKPIDVDELDARIRVLLRMRDRERELALAARVDMLTRLGNRRAFEDALERAWARHARARRPFSVLVGDLDRFKEINDRFGHPMGDEVLRRVGGAIARTIRKEDEAFRIGGEELAVLAPDTTPPGDLALAERIRRAVQATAIHAVNEPGPPVRVAVTLSLGVARFPSPGIERPADLYAAADRALYEAKNTGRNRSVLARPSGYPGALRRSST